ncbi:MAG: zinc ribbon domain-containing protein [Acutalibacteraceae bacterium]|nr:zinc ribbon domain-containing protein [Acutalibacteraceae bacterium]
MFCVSCKKEVPDGIKFCPYCGSKQEVQPVAEPVVEIPAAVEEPVQEEYSAPVEEVYAPVEEPAALDTELLDIPSESDEDKAASVMEETQYIPYEEPVMYQPQPVVQAPPQPPFAGGYYPDINSVPQGGYAVPPQPAPAPATPPKKKKSAALIVVPIILAVFLIIAIFVFGIIFAIFDKNKNSEKQDYITYLTANELYYAEKDNLHSPIKIADIDYDDEAYYFVVENTVVRGDDVFFIQDVEYIGGNPVFSVYVKNTKKNDEAKKIDSDVTSCYFAVDPKGEKVVYTKDSVVYYSDLENTYSIASDVVGWCVDDSVENVMFLRDDGETLSLCTAEITKNASPEILSGEITVLYSVNDDMSRILYSKEDGLYICENGAEKFVDSDVEEVYGEGDYGTFYYVTVSENGVSKSTYFNDDLAATDSYVTEPNLSDYQQYYYGYSFTSPEYYDALEEYNVKLNRDKVREMAATPIVSYDLYYFDGTAANPVCRDVDMYETDYDNSRIVFKCYDAVKANKFRMSDLSVIEDFETKLLDARNQTLTTCFASGSKIARDISFEKAADFKFTDDAVYYLDNCNYIGDSSTPNGELKKITVASDGTVSSALIDREVNFCTVLNDEGKTGYFKSLNSQGCGKFYVDGKLIADGVFMHGVDYVDGKYYLLRNYSYTANKGELCVVENGEITVVSDAVSGYNTDTEGKVFYSSDVKSDSDYNYTFSINCYDGKNSSLMASDTVAWNVQPDYFLECDKGMMMLLTGYRNYYHE